MWNTFDFTDTHITTRMYRNAKGKFRKRPVPWSRPYWRNATCPNKSKCNSKSCNRNITRNNSSSNNNRWECNICQGQSTNKCKWEEISLNHLNPSSYLKWEECQMQDKVHCHYSRRVLKWVNNNNNMSDSKQISRLIAMASPRLNNRTHIRNL